MRALLPLLLCVWPLLAGAAEPGARWWKGNLHTHSLWSDGDDYPEMIADWYKQRGYHFLALSDHNILSDHERWISIAKNKGGEPAFAKYLLRFGEKWVEQRETEGEREVRLKMLSEFRGRFEEAGRFLMIQSEEITGRYLKAPVHVNATNIQELIAPRPGRSLVEVMQNTVNAVIEQRRRTGVPMFPHLNHPNFGWAITAEDLMQLDNERFFEVYNGHPRVHNEGDEIHASTERMWDIVLTRRLAELGKEVIFGLATDDSHNYHQHLGDPKKGSRPGRGWVMVRAAKLNVEDLIAAMEAGDFYASSGVTLKDVRRDADKLSLEIEAEPGISYTTEFIGTRKGYDPKSEPVRGEDGAALPVTHRYSKEIGAVLATAQGASASYSLKGEEIYVRAHVTSSKLKSDPYREGEFEQAWTQPLVAETKSPGGTAGSQGTR
ncbi:MAG: hypothetical protein M3463_07375 [Verrucomicrobiota bacterium]|nr:hypothetical protein [Verrucomicrobiota bacterium]